jgi:hypothetical protein
LIPFFDALTVAVALPVPLSFPYRRGAVFLLSFPARPFPRSRPASVTAIVLARSPGMKTFLTSFEQTTAGARTSNRSPAPEWRLIFGMARRTLVRAHGRSLLPESSCPGGDGNPLRGAASLRLSANQNSIAARACTTSRAGPIWKRSAKRRRALVETNPPRNSRLQTHQNDGTGGEADTASPLHFNLKPDRIDRSAYALKNS